MEADRRSVVARAAFMAGSSASHSLRFDSGMSA